MNRNELLADEEKATSAQIMAALKRLHTAIPAVIHDFDPVKRTCSAQPIIDDFPLCVDVPVFYPSGSGFEITYPVSKGDACLLIFSERCIDDWFLSGNVGKTDNPRLHDLSDGMAFVGFAASTNAEPVNMDRLVIKNDVTALEVGSDGVNVTTGTTVFSITEAGLTCNKPINAPNVMINSVNMVQFIQTMLVHKHPYMNVSSPALTGTQMP